MSFLLRPSFRSCKPCATGYVKVAAGNGNCTLAAPECVFNVTFEVHAPTATSDRLCQPLTQCNASEFEVVPPTLSTDRLCDACQTCPENHAEVAPCSASSDVQCQGCEACTAGITFSTDSCPLKDSNPCRACARCSENEYEARRCQVTQDAVCQPLTQCRMHEYESAAPTATSNRECQAITLCGPQEFETAQPTLTSDRCVDVLPSLLPFPVAGLFCRRCCAALPLPGSLPSVHCCAILFSLIFYRVCRNVSQCLPGHELRQANASSALRCIPCRAGWVDDDGLAQTPCTPCSSGVYVPPMSTGSCDSFLCAPGTADKDASAATPCLPCEGDTYQNNAGRTQCLRLSDCPQGFEWVLASGTPSSDRRCKSCTPGVTWKPTAGIDTRCQNVTVCGPGFGVSVFCGEASVVTPCASLCQSMAVCVAGSGGLVPVVLRHRVTVSVCLTGFAVSLCRCVAILPWHRLAVLSFLFLPFFL